MSEVFTASKHPRTYSTAKEIDEQVSESTGKPAGAFLDILLILAQAFLPMLAKLLPCLNPKPVPPNPDPAPTPEADLAWKNAWSLKGRAEKAFNENKQDYDAHTLRQMSNQIRRQRKKDGEPVDRDEALELARAALDQAREKSQAEIAATILEAQANQ